MAEKEERFFKRVTREPESTASRRDLRRAMVVFGVVSVSVACGGTPTAPIAPDRLPFSGTWVGAVRQVSCSHWDFRTCGRSYPSTSTFTLIVALGQSSQTVTGHFELEMVPGPGAVISARKDSGAIAGQVEDDGAASLTGQTFLDGRPQFEVRDWHIRAQDDGTLSGRFTLFAESTGPPIAQAPLVIQYELLSVRRVTSQP